MSTAEKFCRVCGCTEDNACTVSTGPGGAPCGCSWVAEDQLGKLARVGPICTACANPKIRLLGPRGKPHPDSYAGDESANLPRGAAVRRACNASVAAGLRGPIDPRDLVIAELTEALTREKRRADDVTQVLEVVTGRLEVMAETVRQANALLLAAYKPQGNG